jgi:HD-like signal output (HDOD) protein
MPNLISTFKGNKEEFFTLLWKRVGEQGDFPSLSKSVYDLSETMQSEDKNITDVTTAILSDFTLTQKVIRLANSAMYAGMGGEITTVTKAAVVLGFDAISHLALSVRFVDKLAANSPDSAASCLEMTKALIAGDIARNIANKANLADGEEAVVCSLMHHLGRLLLAYYFPDEWSVILQVSAKESLTENQATLKVIGVTLDEISHEVAKYWHLPKKISNSMVKATSPGGSNIPGSPEWLKSIANFSGEAAEIMIKKGSNHEALKKLASRYGDSLLVSTASIIDSVNKAVAAANDFTILESVEPSQGKPADSKERLAAGVLETTKALSEGMSFGNTLNMVLETLYGSMGFNRVVAFLRDGESYKGKIGFGAMMPELLPRLVFPETYAMDVFHLSLANKADVFIEDANSSKSSASMPAWFTEALPDVRAFVLLPLTFNGHPIGLLYGDWNQGTMGLVEKDELLLMRSLRDHLMKILTPKKSQ